MGTPGHRAHDLVDHVVAGILRVDDLTLLCHRAPERRWFPDVWDLPGGHVEEGEEPLEALRRELREELGIEITTASSTPAGQISGSGFFLRVYDVHTWSGRVRNQSPEEHDAIEWFPPSALASLQLAHPALLPLVSGSRGREVQ